jgi:hypothetical protein
LDIAGHRLFKPVGIKKDEIDKLSFLKLSFANKGLDGINFGNILHHKSVKSKIPPYLKDQSMPIISYVYTRPIASKKYNYKHVLRDLNIDDFKSKLPDCICASSSFISLFGLYFNKNYFLLANIIRLATLSLVTLNTRRVRQRA